MPAPAPAAYVEQLTPNCYNCPLARKHGLRLTQGPPGGCKRGKRGESRKNKGGWKEEVAQEREAGGRGGLGRRAESEEEGKETGEGSSGESREQWVAGDQEGEEYVG